MMTNLRILIIDDEINAIKTLEWELLDLEMPIDVVASFTKVKEAIEYLSHHSNFIDLIFLDIQMPLMNGFEFLERFTHRNFEVIFITAYDGYAIKAIKESALDYILKPVDQDELKQALQKVIAKKRDEAQSTLTPQFNKVSIPLENKLKFLDPKEILYCQSDGNYTKIITLLGETLMVSKTLKHIESLLPEVLFFRIHQSYLINIEKVTAYDRSTNYVMLNNNKELPVARSKRNEFLDHL
jgi:two-component system LytT family response regulator